MRTYRFYIENNKWYIDLPEWKGNKSALEMVLGADNLLHILAQDENEVFVTISTEDMNIAKRFVLTYKKEEGGGGWYTATNDLFSFDLWLCEVTIFVFGYLPEKLYIY